MPRKYEVGEKVKLKWNIDKNGVITISMDELGEEIKLTEAQARNCWQKRGSGQPYYQCIGGSIMVDQVLLNDTLQKINASLNKKI